MNKKATASVLALMAVIVSFAFALVGCSPEAPSTAAADAGLSKGVVRNVEAKSAPMDSNEAQQLANKHLSSGTQCAVCHDGESDPLTAPESGEVCVTCHDYDDLAQSTEHLVDRENRAANPHDSHIGEVDCTLCHSNHSESQYYCLTCHPETEYQDIVVP